LELNQALVLRDAAREMDGSARLDRQVGRHAILATFICTGLRAQELCDLQRRHVDLTNHKLRVGDAKTPAGVREIYLSPFLREVLRKHLKQLAFKGPNAYVFGTAAGKRRDPNRLRDRIVVRCGQRAAEILAEKGDDTMPERVLPHALRRTYVSLQVEKGEDPGWIMDQIGHASANLVLTIYRQRVRRRAVKDPRLVKLLGPVGGD